MREWGLIFLLVGLIAYALGNGIGFLAILVGLILIIVSAMR